MTYLVQTFRLPQELGARHSSDVWTASGLDRMLGDGQAEISVEREAVARMGEVHDRYGFLFMIHAPLQGDAGATDRQLQQPRDLVRGIDCGDSPSHPGPERMMSEPQSGRFLLEGFVRSPWNDGIS